MKKSTNNNNTFEKVTIIIPVYNSEKYIGRCIDSVLNQTFQDFKIILINDGSKDNSLKILNEYKEKYPNKIEVIDQKNMGVAKTRDKGVQLANSKYVMFIDNDDFIDKDYIETFYNKAEKGKYDIVIGGYKRPNSKGKIIRKVKVVPNNFFKYVIMAPWSKIYNREFILKNGLKFLSYKMGEDVYFNLKAVISTKKIGYVDYCGYNWFFNENSVSNTTQRSFKNVDVNFILNSYYNEIKDLPDFKKEYENIERFFVNYVVWYLSFTTKHIEYKNISDEYDKCFEWLEKHFPNYKKNKLIRLNKPKEYEFYVRALTVAFMFFHKIHLGKIVVYLYSRI